ncbi:hypothetical protein J6895_02839 [Nakaseomyces glabratus]|nr:hypothetical protein J6895_02839 [Nakaseomyces glabratus]
MVVTMVVGLPLESLVVMWETRSVSKSPLPLSIVVVVGLAGITWLQWDGGDDGGRVAVGVLGGDVGDEVCLEVTVALVDRRRVVGLAGITWLQWDGGDDGGRVAVGVLGGDVGDEVCLEVTVALVDRRRVGLAGITWLQWDGGDDGGRVAVGVLGGDVETRSVSKSPLPLSIVVV